MSSRTGGDVDPARFHLHRLEVESGIEIAYVRVGVGGVPLLLVHGWPSTKRLFWRVIEPLADAGFEVIVPDIRGWGDSTSPDDPARWATFPTVGRDFATLLERLGHSSAVLASGDQGSFVVQHMAMRYEQLVCRLVLWNGGLPRLPQVFADAGIPGDLGKEIAEVSDHMVELGTDGDALVAELGAQGRCADYVAGYYQGRSWRAGDEVRYLAPPGVFDDEAAQFMAEPFADASTMRSSLALYEVMAGRRTSDEPSLLDRRNEVTETLAIYGPEDQIIGDRWIARAAVSFGRTVGPFVVPGAGHFMPYEQPKAFVDALRLFCRDLLPPIC